MLNNLAVTVSLLFFSANLPSALNYHCRLFILFQRLGANGVYKFFRTIVSFHTVKQKKAFFKFTYISVKLGESKPVHEIKKQFTFQYVYNIVTK